MVIRKYERKDKKIKNSTVKYFRKDSISTNIFRKPNKDPEINDNSKPIDTFNTN